MIRWQDIPNNFEGVVRIVRLLSGGVVKDNYFVQLAMLGGRRRVVRFARTRQDHNCPWYREALAVMPDLAEIEEVEAIFERYFREEGFDECLCELLTLDELAPRPTPSASGPWSWEEIPAGFVGVLRAIVFESHGLERHPHAHWVQLAWTPENDRETQIVRFYHGQAYEHNERDLPWSVDELATMPTKNEIALADRAFRRHGVNGEYKGAEWEVVRRIE
mgnify:CR=1 FL=1